jgi:hypothetical protein
MDYPDIFGYLSPKIIRFIEVNEQFSYKVVPKSVETLSLEFSY